MQIPILNGSFADASPDFRTAYPVNYVPVPKQTGISAGYLRPADGVESFATGTGVDRGGFNWNGVCYRVSGSRLIRVNEDGTVGDLGDVGGTTLQASMDVSFDRLGIASDGKLFYWNGTTLTQVTDPDLGTVVDVVWVDGYFMTTDGEFLVVTELNDPLSVNPLKYGSSEIDPDPVVALLKIRNEPYAINRYTIEVFENIGGDLFPFQRIDGAQLQKGAVGTKAACIFVDQIAFLGSGRNEPLSVYLGANATTLKVATREIDTLLQEYTEAELALTVVEARTDRNNAQLWIHLPDRVLVYDFFASQAAEEPVWAVLTAATVGFGAYPARGMVWCYGRWIFGDPFSTRIGTFNRSIGSVYGEHVRWEFATLVMYNDGLAALLNELELVALTGAVAPGASPTISTSYSTDGETWSVPRSILAGRRGERAKRLVWLQQGPLRNWRIQRFQGSTAAHLAFARLEATFEQLAH